MELIPLSAAAGAACGGKARGLAALLRAGLPVPEGWVLDDRAFRAIAGPIPEAGLTPEAAEEEAAALAHALVEAAARVEEPGRPPLPRELIAAVEARALALAPLAVRSSAAIEDAATGAAPGVLTSRIGIAAGDVWSAIRAVWSSALTPLAVGYARSRAHGSRPRLAVAVILQRAVPGARVTVYTRPPGAPTGDEVWIQRGSDLERRPRASASEDAVASIAIAAERAIAAHAGADVELIVDGDRAPWVVQARPVVHPARRDPRPAPPAIVLAPLVADGRRWVWDVAHNPDPLSPAQAALVERVERAGSAPWAMRVCAGYLYTAPRAPTAPPPDRPASIAALAARSREVERRIAAALDEAEPIAGHEPAGREPEPASIEAAVARYLAFYQLWARELVPLAAAARHLAPTSARSARPSALDAALRAAARGERSAASVIEQFGVLAPAWDVAVPTFAEQPSVVSGAIARLRAALASAPTRADPAPRDPDPDRELAEDLGERDDLWFARAQWLVRRALLSRAAAIGLPAEHAGWVPLDALATATAEAVGDLRRTAAAARAAATRATGWAMPATVIRDAEGALGSAEDPPPHQTLHGVGLGGRVTGRVRRFASLATASAAAPVDVVVTRAVTPALAALVAGCAALVSESGGLLDHGAALARELGIPCVVGCRGAWQRLEDGALVTVDGDRGTVTAHDR